MNSKLTNLLILIFAALLFNVKASAQCSTSDPVIDSKIRFLGSWAPNGKPDYLTTPDTISQEVLDLVANALPETDDITGTIFFNNDVKPNTELTDTAEIFLTLVQEVASWKNTLGFYTYDVENPPSSYEDIDSLVILFPNLDAPNVVKPGDKISLGTFLPKTGIGYFLIAKGWVGDTVCMDSHIIYTDKTLNHDNYQQTVLLHYEEMLILGIEDNKRPTGDNDFNDAVFYITADKFTSIDTTNIPKVAVAEISGDTVLCSDDDLAEITIDIIGSPPFDIKYFNGTDTIEVNDINSNIYTFFTAIRDTFTLVSVKNGGGFGLVKGRAVVQQSNLNAYFSVNEIQACEGTTGVSAEITLGGVPPFNITYTEDDVEITIDNILENKVEIPVTVGKSYSLVRATDQHCSLETEDDLSIEVIDAPSASIEDIDVSICEGEEVELTFAFEGTAPFTLVYSKNGENDTITTNELTYTIIASETAEIVPVKIIDSKCESTEVSGVAKVTVNPLPTVSIDAPAVGCGNEESITLTLTFTGTAPFSFQYDLNGTTVEGTTPTNTADIELLVDQRLELLSFRDANCEGELDENESVFHHYPLPSATITTENAAICEGASATIEIGLKGKGPWTFVITDGIENDTITTSSNHYTYLASNASTYELLAVWNEECDHGEISGVATIITGETPSVSVDASNNTFCGNNPAIIGLSFTGVSPWTFDVKNGDDIATYTSTSDIFELEVSLAGEYEIINLQDANCASNAVAEFDVIELPEPTAALAVDGNSEICDDEETTLVVTLTGTAPFTFAYTVGNETYTIETDQEVYTFSTSIGGTYRLISVSDANCSAEATGEVVITNLADELGGEIIADDLTCEGEQVALAFAGSGVITAYEWSTNGLGQLEAVSLQEANYTPAEGETGKITFQVAIENSCIAMTIEKEIEIAPNPEATFTMNPEEPLAESPVTFTADHDGYDHYAWDFGDGSTGNGNPAQHTYNEAGEYSITLTVEHMGCIAEGTASAQVKTKNDLYVPNVFNPNALNDENRVVKVYGTNVSEDGFAFKIVNRWGKVMYETNSFAEANSFGWVGQKEKNDEMQALSAFTYLLRGQFKDGEVFERTGTITLLQ